MLPGEYEAGSVTLSKKAPPVAGEVDSLSENLSEPGPAEGLQHSLALDPILHPQAACLHCSRFSDQNPGNPSRKVKAVCSYLGQSYSTKLQAEHTWCSGHWVAENGDLHGKDMCVWGIERWLPHTHLPCKSVAVWFL